MKKFNSIFWLLSKEETDLVNVILNIVENHDSILKPDNEIKDYELNRCIITNLHELSASLGLVTLDTSYLTTLLDSLTKTVATVYFDDEEHRRMEKTTFINKYSLTSTDNNLNKRITLWLCSTLIDVLLAHKDLFILQYKFAHHALKSKYSKMIYQYFINQNEIADEVVLDIDTFGKMMDKELIQSHWDWSKLNANILKRAVKEINTKSNLRLDYEKVKTDDTGRKQTTQIKFVFSVKNDDVTDCYFDSDFILNRKVKYYIEKSITAKMESVMRFKDQNAIRNPGGYKHKLRTKELVKQDMYKARIRLQDWSNAMKYASIEKYGLVCLRNYDNFKRVTINNDYLLYDFESGSKLTSTAQESLEELNKFLKARGKCVIYNPPKYYKNCSISYTER